MSRRWAARSHRISTYSGATVGWSRETVAAQPFMVRALPGGGTARECSWTPRWGAGASSTIARSRNWSRSGCLLHDRLGGPQDVEWAISGGELYVLQARPVTA